MALIRARPIVTALFVAALTGCGASQTSSSVSPSSNQTAQASRDWNDHVRDWRQELLAAADQDKEVKFPTPTEETFRKRLAAAASDFHFHVISVEFVRAPQGAPLVIVEASSPSQFSRDTPAIFQSLDPKRGGSEDWQGWDYEGFFLGAQDESGDPFLAVFNFMRDHGGGQWARNQELFPFPHG